jgi:hypothetical protein
MCSINRSHGACPLLTGVVVSAVGVSHHPYGTLNYFNYNRVTASTRLQKLQHIRYVKICVSVPYWRGHNEAVVPSSSLFNV